MRVVEYGKGNEKELLFLSCTAEPEWAFSGSVKLLSQYFHVMQVIYDGHDEKREDFISVETTVNEILLWLKEHGIKYLDAAYGCSLGGACLIRILSLGKIPVRSAIIDAGITPYQMPLLLRHIACFSYYIGFRLIVRSRKVLEKVYPPERWTLPGWNSREEYDALMSYLKTYSNKTIRNIFWSANNYSLPIKPAETNCRIIYWYGEEEKKARHHNIRFIKSYFPNVRTASIEKMGHAELVMTYPEQFFQRTMAFFEEDNKT